MINTHAQARTAFSELKQLEHTFWHEILSEEQLLDIVERKHEIFAELEHFAAGSELHLVVDNTVSH